MRDENLTTPPSLTPAEAAVLYLLKRLQVDADLRWHMLGTEALARLCAAEAARTGSSVDSVEQKYAALLPGSSPSEARLPRARKRLEDIASLAADALDCPRRALELCGEMGRLAQRPL